jgi:hypothetical protein
LLGNSEGEPEGIAGSLQISQGQSGRSVLSIVGKKQIEDAGTKNENSISLQVCIILNRIRIP